MFNTYKKFLVVVAVFIISFALRAEFGDWVTYSAITQSNDIYEIDGSTGNTVAFATDGGVLFFNSIDGDYNIIDNDDGLFSINISSITEDFRGVFWAVNRNGSVSLFKNGFEDYSYLTDLPSSGIFNINKVYSSEKYVYIAADNVFVRYKYNQSFNKYHVKDNNLDVEDVYDVIVFEDNIYISTRVGIFFIDEDSENISALDPLWSINNLSNTIKTNKFFIADDSLYALTNDGIYHLDEEESEEVDNALSDMNILDGMDNNGNYYFLTGDEDKDNSREMYCLVDITSNTSETIFSENNFDGTDNFIIKDDVVYLTSSLNNGVKFFSLTNNVFSNFGFNLPFGKGLKSGHLDNSGKLIYSNNNYFNFLDIESDDWKKTSNARENWIKNIFQDSRGNYFTGQWLNGLSQYYIDNQDSIVPIRDYSFVDVSNAQHPAIGEDSKGNLWISNWRESDLPGPSLVKLNPATAADTSNYSYEEYEILGMIRPYELYVDNKDWIWLGSSKENFSTLEGLAICKLMDDGSLVYSVLPEFGVGITSIVTDRNGITWIGTNNGLKYMDVSSSSIDPIGITMDAVHNIPEGPISNFIYDIEVNSLNEKWIATDKGISVVSGDGNEWRHYVPNDFNSDGLNILGEHYKTPILDATITEIEFDEDNGKVYFISSNGISVFDYSGVSKDSQLKYDIATIPSPFMSNGSSVMKFIIPDNGKFYDSAKIFDLRGRLVKGGLTSDAFKILNGWNGKDNNGKIVSSGVYQVVIYDSNNPEEKLFGKIAVVRKK